jgi:hypothetical protein
MAYKKKSREELISNGFCPICSRCTGQADTFERLVLHSCSACGFLMADLSGRYEGPFVEITAEQWEEIQRPYRNRIADATEQALRELPEIVARVMAGRNAELTASVN